MQPPMILFDKPILIMAQCVNQLPKLMAILWIDNADAWKQTKKLHDLLTRMRLSFADMTHISQNSLSNNITQSSTPAHPQKVKNLLLEACRQLRSAC